MRRDDVSFWEREHWSWPHRELSRFVEAGGQRWHVQQSGAGPALLLVHGTGASTHSWRKLLPLLARHFAVTVVDLPGHGFTTPVAHAARPPSARASAASISGMAACLAALLRKLAIDVEYCAGHSAGAVVLCRMALDRLIAPRVIIAVNGAFVPLAGAAGTWLAPVARLMAGGVLVPRLVAWSAGNAARVSRLLAATGSRLGPEDVELYARLVREPRHVAGALAMMGNWNLYAFERDLSKLETPLALLVGENDRTVAPSQASWVQRRVRSARIHRLPGLGHLAHEEDPERVAREIFAICREHGDDAVSAPAAASADPSGPPSAH